VRFAPLDDLKDLIAASRRDRLAELRCAGFSLDGAEGPKGHPSTAFPMV
jgi:hypothetical protein